MGKPSKPSETLGEDATPPTWSSEWLKRTPNCEPPDFPTTNMHPFKHEERVVSRVDTVTTDQHEDLILCEAVIEFDEIEFDVDEPPASALAIHSPLARRRAGQRWSALVTAPNSRIARIMRPVLDEACVLGCLCGPRQCALPRHLPGRLQRLLRCVGRVSGAPWPRDATVDLSAPDAAKRLAHLRLDHGQDLQITCDMWKAAICGRRRCHPRPLRGMTASTALSCEAGDGAGGGKTKRAAGACEAGGEAGVKTKRAAGACEAGGGAPIASL